MDKKLIVIVFSVLLLTNCNPGKLALAEPDKPVAMISNTIENSYPLHEAIHKGDIIHVIETLELF